MTAESLIGKKSTKSQQMARVRSKDTVPEMVVRRALHARGYRFRLHRGDLPGRPDIALPRHRLAIFVHVAFGMDAPGVIGGYVDRKAMLAFGTRSWEETEHATLGILWLS